MTETAERADLSASLAREPVLRAAKPPTPTRHTDPDWVDWCDADR